ncbi:MAG: UDP-3-O-acyl-N-acetylglucosamine deacetylase [Oligoflexus sp.]
MNLNEWQTTIRRKVSFVGKGLHSGRIVTMEISPAEADHGIVFQRSDCQDAQPIAALLQNISSTRLNTTIGFGGSSVSTIEHLMAAFAGLGIHNAMIRLNGPEVPILDGSAKPFIKQLQSVGTRSLSKLLRVWRIKTAFEFQQGDQFIRLLPSDRQRIKCSIDFDHKVIGYQSIDFRPNLEQFLTIAQARTFCHYKDVNILRQQGLALGGSLENAVVIDGQGVMNEEGLRSPLEFVQHKLLDLIGDLSLLGAPIWGDIITHKPGHQLHANFMAKLMEHHEQIFESVAAHQLIAPKDEEASLFGSAIATFG